MVNILKHWRHELFLVGVAAPAISSGSFAWWEASRMWSHRTVLGSQRNSLGMLYKQFSFSGYPQVTSGCWCCLVPFHTVSIYFMFQYQKLSADMRRLCLLLCIGLVWQLQAALQLQRRWNWCQLYVQCRRHDPTWSDMVKSQKKRSCEFFWHCRLHQLQGTTSGRNLVKFGGVGSVFAVVVSTVSTNC